jgi:hypothetical protein
MFFTVRYFVSFSVLKSSSFTMARGSGLLLALLASSSVVLGASTNFTTNWNPNGYGCVDTKGFLSCYDTQASQGTTCVDNCANTNKEGTTAYQNCVNGVPGYGLPQMWDAGFRVAGVRLVCSTSLDSYI